jgi:hypothetical protein
LLGRNMEIRHQVITQWHDDHEIQNVREVDRG